MSESPTYVLPTEFTIYEALEVYDDIMECLDSHGTCQLDGSRVEEVDTAGIQLLCKFLNSKPPIAQKVGGVESSKQDNREPVKLKMSLIDPSERLLKSLALLKLDSMSMS